MFLIISAILIIILNSALYFGRPYFVNIYAFAILLIFIHFILNRERKIENLKKEEIEWLYFINDLQTTYKATQNFGATLLKVSKNYYGNLTPHIQRFANKISWGYNIKEAFKELGAALENTKVKQYNELIIENLNRKNLFEILPKIEQDYREYLWKKEEEGGVFFDKFVIFSFFSFIFIFYLLHFSSPLFESIDGIKTHKKILYYGIPFSFLTIFMPIIAIKLKREGKLNPKNFMTSLLFYIVLFFVLFPNLTLKSQIVNAINYLSTHNATCVGIVKIYKEKAPKMEDLTILASEDSKKLEVCKNNGTFILRDAKEEKEEKKENKEEKAEQTKEDIKEDISENMEEEPKNNQDEKSQNNQNKEE